VLTTAPPHGRKSRWTDGQRLPPRKCNEFETHHGDIVVRQARRPRSRKTEVSRALRPYTVIGSQLTAISFNSASLALQLCRLTDIRLGWERRPTVRYGI
jgi:hypothetical protein